MSNSSQIICNLCGSSKIKELLSFPNYPVSSVYLPTYSDDSKYVADFDLCYCDDCKHIQGYTKFQLSTFYNYDCGYTTNNANNQQRLDLVADRIFKHCAGKKFNRVIDIGCNDLSLLKRLKKLGISAKHYIGIDPVPNKKNDLTDGFLFLNGYVQDIQLPYYDSELPDLVVSDQALEHIPNVNVMLAQFSDQVALNSSFMVCVPSMELLIDNLIFPTIIHEHLNYFSEYSLAKLFNNCKFNLEFSELIDVIWGFIFQVYTKTNKHQTQQIESLDLVPLFNQNYQIFINNLEGIHDLLSKVEGKIYGFGASDVITSFAYLMKSDFSHLDFIIDDTPYKENMYIPGLKPRILKSSDIDDWSDAVVLITAPQASRAIIKRLLSLNPKKIISPLTIF